MLLLVSHDMFMQGSQFFLLRLAMGLRALGWRHVELLAPQDGPMRKVLNDKGFFVHVAKSVPAWLQEHGSGYAAIHYNTVIMCWAYLHAPGAGGAEPVLPGAAFSTMHESKPDGAGLALATRCPRLADAFAAECVRAEPLGCARPSVAPAAAAGPPKAAAVAQRRSRARAAEGGMPQTSAPKMAADTAPANTTLRWPPAGVSKPLVRRRRTAARERRLACKAPPLPA
jgi:hypothetical protein